MEDTLKNVGNQTVDGPQLTYIVRKKILWKSMGSINFLVTDIFQNILYVQQKKKNSYRFETTRKLWHNFHL